MFGNRILVVCHGHQWLHREFFPLSKNTLIITEDLTTEMWKDFEILPVFISYCE